jgi:GNAT superfamily N-acetyltransferase
LVDICIGFKAGPAVLPGRHVSGAEDGMDIRVVPLDNSLRDDFYRVHSEEYGHNWCYCVAWWIPTWHGWEHRMAEQNRMMREQLFEVEEYDGYLLYDGDKPIGWCQVGPRDRLKKLIIEYKLPNDSDIWAVTCFFIAPGYREIGLGSYMLSEILIDLKKRGVRYVQGFPRRGKKLKVEDLWTGPESYFVKNGFKLERDDPIYPIYGKEL